MLRSWGTALFYVNTGPVVLNRRTANIAAVVLAIVVGGGFEPGSFIRVAIRRPHHRSRHCPFVSRPCAPFAPILPGSVIEQAPCTIPMLAILSFAAPPTASHTFSGCPPRLEKALRIERNRANEPSWGGTRLQDECFSFQSPFERRAWTNGHLSKSRGLPSSGRAPSTVACACAFQPSVKTRRPGLQGGTAQSRL